MTLAVPVLLPASLHVSLLPAAPHGPLASPTPTPTTSTSTPGFGPSPSSPSSGASAGLDAFLIVIALIAVTVVIFIAMNGSLRRMRTNLGGNVLPRREADRLPVRPQDRDLDGPDGSGGADAGGAGGDAGETQRELSDDDPSAL